MKFEMCSKKTWCLTSTETVRLIRDGENGAGGGGGGGVWRRGQGNYMCRAKLKGKRGVYSVLIKPLIHVLFRCMVEEVSE